MKNIKLKRDLFGNKSAAKWASKKVRYLAKENHYKKSSKNPFLSDREWTFDIASTSRTIVKPQTIRNILHDANIRGKIPLIKHLLEKQTG